MRIFNIIFQVQLLYRRQLNHLYEEKKFQNLLGAWAPWPRQLQRHEVMTITRLILENKGMRAV